jgi:nucleoside transporter
MTDTTVRSRYLRISLMMFLQFFTWGAWFTTLYVVLGKNGFTSEIIGKCYGTAPIAAIFAPLFLGLFADRFFSSERLMALIFLVGGALMLFVPGIITAGNSSLLVIILTAHMLCFMPTLGLGNTIAFSHLPRDVFPKTRVWGTIGWIAAGLLAGFMGWSDSLNLFRMAGISALLLGLFSFFLPHTPPPSRGKPINLRAIFMVDAFGLLARPAFFVFILCSMLICIPLAYYFNSTSGFLANMGFKQPASAMSIGQMSEIFFMLLVPFFFRKLGVKWMIIVAMLCWVLRYALFAYGASEQSVMMIFAAIALHGICYDFFFVTGFMYADRTAPESIRGQTQSMLVFFTQGVGMFIGYGLAAKKMTPVEPASKALGAAISATNPTEKLSYAQQLGQMFAAEIPKVDATVYNTAAQLWKTYWLFPAMLAGGVALLFLMAFWDRSKTQGE